MKGRITHKLKEFSSKIDVNKDTYVQVDLSGERKLLPPGDINKIVDVGEEFNIERQKSKCYRFTGTISPLFSNVLFNITGNDTLGGFGTSTIFEYGNGYNTFNASIFKTDPFDNDFFGTDDLTYKESLNKHLVERDGWFGFDDPDITKASDCNFYEMEPTRKRFDLNANIKKNWDITITYPYDSDDSHYIIDGGLLITEAVEVNVGNVPMVALAAATYHGLSNGDKVKLTDLPTSSFDKTYTIQRLGLDNGDLKGTWFAIDVDPLLFPLGTMTSRMKRVVAGVESKYYLRKFKQMIDSNDDYEIYPLGFSKSIFNDENFQVNINQDIDVSGLKDNLGRPLSELYYTFIKTDSEGTFTGVKSGLDLELTTGNLSEDISNVRRIHDGTTTPFQTQTPLEDGVTLSTYDEFYGDVVEYSPIEVRETILSDVLHRFNTTDRKNGGTSSVAQGPRNEGYTYKPHHLIKIRQYSAYVEQGYEIPISGAIADEVPDYAEDLGDGRFLWRDLLDIGVTDGGDEVLNYPFTNGCHYIHNHICLPTKRQDAFGYYGLYYAGTTEDEGTYDPADPRGDSMTDNFKVNIAGDAC